MQMSSHCSRDLPATCTGVMRYTMGIFNLSSLFWQGHIILQVGSTSIILYNLLGPKVGKLVKKKTLCHSPVPGAAPTIFTGWHVHPLQKPQTKFQVRRLSGLKVQKSPAKKNQRKMVLVGLPSLFVQISIYILPWCLPSSFESIGRAFYFKMFFLDLVTNPHPGPHGGAAPPFIHILFPRSFWSPHPSLDSIGPAVRENKSKNQLLTDRQTHTHTRMSIPIASLELRSRWANNCIIKVLKVLKVELLLIIL